MSKPKPILNLLHEPMSDVDARMAARGYVRVRVLADLVGVHFTTAHRYVRSHKVPTLRVVRGAGPLNQFVYVNASKFVEKVYSFAPQVQAEIKSTLTSNGVKFA